MDFFPALTLKHIEFIKRQSIFFVATAGAQGRVNLSPKGLESLRVVDESDGSRVRWLNLTGSGNETAAHVLENARMTLMFCSFEKQPLILRVYGSATMVSNGDPGWEAISADFPPREGARQIFELAVESVQTSCGYGVPLMEFVSERETLTKWTEKKGAAAIAQYQQDNNALSIDGLPTGLPSLTQTDK